MMRDLGSAEDYRAMMVEFADLSVAYGLNLLTAIAILLAGFAIARWVARLVRTRLQDLKRFDDALIPVVVQIARYAILVFTLILVLAEFGIQTTSIIAVLGAAGLAIGLALQGTLQNVAAGFMSCCSSSVPSRSEISSRRRQAAARLTRLASS